jgi:hypothetical protein
MPETSIVKKIHKWKPLTRRPVGKPKPRWEDDVRNDLKKTKLIKLAEQVQDRLNPLKAELNPICKSQLAELLFFWGGGLNFAHDFRKT